MNPVEALMTIRPQPGDSSGRRAPQPSAGGPPMLPRDFHRLRRATVETPIILVYAAAIVTIITVLYWLLGG